MFENETVNQHFVSQAEQRLNSFNPSATKKKRRIYVFEVTDRDKPSLALIHANGQLITRSLSFDDLFSFDVRHAKYRTNLESVFERYERLVATHSQELVCKLSSGGQQDLKEHLLELFAAKFLNMVRNPNSVTKVLNTLGAVADYRPTDPQLLQVFDQVRSGSRRHSERVCEQFGLTSEDYERWLRTLFLLLTKPKEETLNMFESTIKGLFESHWTAVHVYEYTGPDPQQVCLLSDRSFNIPLETGSMLALEFNVSSRSFVRYTFCQPEHHAPVGTRSELLEALKATVQITRFENDLDALARYNQLTCVQCASTVFAASPSPMLTA